MIDTKIKIMKKKKHNLIIKEKIVIKWLLKYHFFFVSLYR